MMSFALFGLGCEAKWCSGLFAGAADSSPHPLLMESTQSDKPRPMDNCSGESLPANLATKGSDLNLVAV